MNPAGHPELKLVAEGCLGRVAPAHDARQSRPLRRLRRTAPRPLLGRAARRGEVRMPRLFRRLEVDLRALEHGPRGNPAEPVLAISVFSIIAEIVRDEPDSRDHFQFLLLRPSMNTCKTSMQGVLSLVASAGVEPAISQFCWVLARVTGHPKPFRAMPFWA